MRLIALSIAAIIGISVVAACQSAVLPPIPPSTAESTSTPHTQQVGIVFENGDIEPNPLYELALSGAEDAAVTFPIEVTPLEIQHQENVTTDVENFVAQGYDLLIGVGTQPLHQAIVATASANPDQLFVSVEQLVDEPNVLSIQFDMAEPSFLAGYLAAGISATGRVCTYGGLDVPAAIDYLEGFASGVRYYNMQHGADVALLGWDNDMRVGALNDSLQSSGDERQLVIDYFDAGCDVLFPVTRTINLGLASMAQDYELAVIGTDVDWFFIAPEFGEIWLTSVQKNLDRAMFDTIAALMRDELVSSGNYVGTSANGGVGLAPFHLWNDKIPDDLKTELKEIQQAFVSDELEP